MLERALSRPKLVHSTSSPYSGTINVWQRGSERILEVGDYPQSVGLDAYDLEGRFWSRIVAESLKFVPNPKAVLILGLGGGTEAHLFSRRSPDIAIDVVEIDPVIVQVGKRFFKLDDISNLQIVVADALKVVKDPSDYPLRFPQYDLLVADAYVGDRIPPGLDEEWFLRGLKSLLTPRGVAVFNRVSQASPQEFRSKLEHIFDKVEEVGVSCGWGLPPGNILFLCS
jgi:spermidine synthase